MSGAGHAVDDADAAPAGASHVAEPGAAVALYRALFDAAPDALLLADRDGRILLANSAASRLLGYRVDELHGLPIDALVPDAIRDSHAALRAGYASQPRPRAMGTQADLVARRRDGSVVAVEISLSPLQHGGRPLVMAAVRGVEDYPRVKQALQRARYSECVARVGRLAVDSRDPQRLLQHVPAVAREALQAEAVFIHLHDAARQRFALAAAAPADADGDAAEPPALAVPLSDRGQVIGRLSARVPAGRRFGDDERNFLGALANLLATSLQRARGEEALSHAQRLESVGQLTGGIAHDFNNLLTIIQGNLQVLEEHPAVRDEAHAQQLIGSAHRASRRAAELTGKLLAFSRRQVLSPRRVDVPALLESLADMLRRTIEQHIRIELAVDDAAFCEADPGQLEAAVLNLAINARDAMPDGGRITFACRPPGPLAPDVAAELGVPAEAAERFVEIEVADTGRGMPEAVRERAFEPFFTTKEYGRGTGLGLATVYGFVKQSRGVVRLHSVPGEGTRVTLLLPRSAGDDGNGAIADAGADDAADEAPLPRGLRVLLVEDEDGVRQVAQGFLEALHCRVTAFATAEAALAALEAPAASDAGGDPAHDLLVSDIALGPGLRGTELARRVQNRVPGIAVLLMSGYSSQLLLGPHADDAGPDLLRKPFSREQLARAIARALRAV